MKKILEYVFSGRTLGKEEAFRALSMIAKGEANHSQMAAFLTVFLMRPPRVDELMGFRDALLDLCRPVDLACGPVVDLCGTGGDGKDTFNISTLSAFVVAGAGIPVAKHGNYGVSSVSGSSNVMEALGYRFTDNTDTLKRQIGEAGICFLHAPLFHPAMKNVGPIRKELGVKTFFNMLGPLVNPARPAFQCTGVYNMELARLYRFLLEREDRSFRVIHSLDGYDEVSLTGAVKVFSEKGEQTLSPEAMGMTELSPEALYGGSTVEAAARIFTSVLDGKATQAQRSVVIANAALAISGAKDISLEQGIGEATDSLDAGKAKKCFQKLIGS